MTIGKLSGQCDFGQKGQSYCNQRGQSCVAKRVKVAWLFQLLMLGVTVLFLLQSCVTVRKSRHPHHHRHCMVINSQITDMTKLNTPSIYMASESPTVYEHKG